MNIDRFYHRNFRYRHHPPKAAPTTNRDQKWLKRAAKAASQVEGKWRVGCVIVKSGRVLAVAANSRKNDPSVCVDRFWCSSDHAETAALRMVSDPYGATAYVARIGRDGSPRHAQPCVRCQEMLDKYQVRAVWTSDLEYIKERRKEIAAGNI